MCPAHKELRIRWRSVHQGVLPTPLGPGTILAVCFHSYTMVRSTTPVWRWLEGRPGAALWWTVIVTSSPMSGATATTDVSSVHQPLTVTVISKIPHCLKREDPLIFYLQNIQIL